MISDNNESEDEMEMDYVDSNLNTDNAILIPPPASFSGPHAPSSDNNNPAHIEQRSSSPVSSTQRTDSPYLQDENSRQSSEGSPTKKRQYEQDVYENENEDDGMLCPICLDNWTTTGEHRICALKCGHLFGYKCVKRWLERENRKICPTCKKHVKKSDIRYIYAKKLIAVDTVELEDLRKQLKQAIEEKNRIQNEMARYSCREQLLNQEIATLKGQLNYSLAKRIGDAQPFTQPVTYLKVYMEKNLQICKNGGCRVFDADPKTDLLMASIKSPTNIFNGYGLKKLKMSNYKQLAFVPIHQLQIRDVCFHPETHLVLTVSMDKYLKVVDNITNAVTHSFSHSMPLWSCCWDLSNPYQLYVGTQIGSVLKYDTRRLTEPVHTFAIENDLSPVVSVASIPPGDVMSQSAVVSCKLSSLWLFEDTTTAKRHQLPLEGPFISMTYERAGKQLLVSSRPNSRISHSRHILCTLGHVEELDSVGCNVIHTFQGGGMQKLLSKSCFLSRGNDDEYVAAHNENAKSVFLWSVNSGEKVASLPALETVLDLKGVQNQNGDFLVSLTEKKLEFFKFAD